MMRSMASLAAAIASDEPRIATVAAPVALSFCRSISAPVSTRSAWSTAVSGEW
jgi:hypothetical protein